MNEQLSMFGEPAPVNRPLAKKTGVIYETAGRAREYRELACNLYTGCDHGCVYCYVPSALQRDRATFHTDIRPRDNILKKLEQDALYRQQMLEQRQILFSFACDPYSPGAMQYGLMGPAIEICHDHNLAVCILSKGGQRALVDVSQLTVHDSWATSLTLLDEDKSLIWEPGAAPPLQRIEALQIVHNLGIPTWVSLEPVIEPGQTLRLIQLSQEFTDHYKVGTLNHHPHAKTIDWPYFARRVVELLESLGKSYYLKDDLRRFLDADWLKNNAVHMQERAA